jgi:signal-transduction protein with cAMP-binding, CBS, and nucleotidyltransferase domain
LEVEKMLAEVELEAGEFIFHKGDPGDCMYILVDGKVRVFDGDRTLNFLGKRQVFGEMAVLDPEPRSASVETVEATKLFRLEQKSLFDLLTKRSDVTQGIIQILCQRLRARMHDMAEDYKYMQQFQRVVAAAVAVEAGVYEPESLDEVSERKDELGQLARVFQRMTREVDVREQRLKQQVAELRIEIDEAKMYRKVAEITETDYFQGLLDKATSLRAAMNNPTSSG